MIFVLALYENKYLLCNDDGSQTTVASKYDITHSKNKVCKFNEDKLAIISSENKIVKNSYTVLGKFYRGKNRESFYLVCNAIGKRSSLSKNQLIQLSKTTDFTNIVISSDNRVRMLSGSIPLLVNVDSSNRNNTNDDTVVKVCDIQSGTSGSLGVGKKFFGKRIKDGKVGVVKFSLTQDSLDINNEVIAYELGKILGFDIAEASFEKYKHKKCVISIYNYDFTTEKIKSLRECIGTDNFDRRFNRDWVVHNFSQEAWDKFLQMIMLDLIMHQTDRHISNIAFKGNTLYSLYDNGRALLFDSDLLNVDLNSRSSIVNSFYRNEHGYGWMYLEDILGYNNYKHLINHNVTYEQIEGIVNKCYGTSNIKKNKWVSLYMYRVYLIITRQEKRDKSW